MTATRGHSQATRILAIVDLNGPAQEWAASILSLTRSGAEVLVLAGSQVTRARRLLVDMPVQVEGWPLSQAIEHLAAGAWQVGLIVTAPTILPPDPFAACETIFGRDPRIATVSFFSNDASYLSFPRSHRPSAVMEPGWDEARLTARLRELHPVGQWVPIPLPAGGAVMVSVAAVRALGPWEDTEFGGALSVVDFAATAARRGLRNVLDPRTFVTRPATAVSTTVDPLADPEARGWVEIRHPQAYALYDAEHTAQGTPLEQVATAARCGALGMRVLMECDVLGPRETGTQVALLATVDALAHHPLVRELLVGVPHGTIPDYAWETLTQQGVTVVNSSGYEFAGVTDVDILYRPYQPQGDLPYAQWRTVSRRIVASVLDLIAYDNGAYHATPHSWLEYRASIRSAVASLDAVVAISHDTAAALQAAELPISPDRLSVVALGADHLTVDADEQCPALLAELGVATEPFLFVLGAAYAHKNRDLAIKAWRLLRERGHALNLVLAGVVMGGGSSRNDEALLLASGDQPIILPDVERAERAWLYRHAAAVLYPTSAEGFGLIPFEAASFGRPCAFVPFGPLQEFLAGVGGEAADWSPEAFADAVEHLLTHPDDATAQVARIQARGADLTWRRTAAGLVEVFLSTLRLPQVASSEFVNSNAELRADVARTQQEADRAHAIEAENAALKSRLKALSPLVRAGGFLKGLTRKSEGERP